ncbi:hypothetical protein [Dactylosporangium sp. CA-139066]|uniref:hypothetical protein n=1 Tax=Dactylosporangium sp. CA-139066 TaxID=3239930 RepID=UPI003D89E503
MRKRGFVLLWLAGIAVAALTRRSCNGLQAARNLRQVGEVLSVVEGARPGTVVVHTHNPNYRDDQVWLVGDDGDVTAMDADAVEAPGATPQRQACAGDSCYRVAGDTLRVEGSTDGGRTWATAWEVSAPAYAALVHTYPDLGDPARHLASTSLVVHAVAGGHVVYVADGRDGLLRRDRTGAWQRIGSPDSGEGCCFLDPVPRLSSDPVPFDPAPYAAGAAAVVILAAGGIAAARRRNGRWSVLLAVAALAALGGYMAYLGAGIPDAGMFPGLLYGIPCIVLSLAGGALLAVRFVRPPRPAEEGGDPPSSPDDQA